MGAFWELFGTAMAAAGLAVLLWWQAGRLLRPVPGRNVQVVISGHGDGEELEQTLRALYWLRGLGLLRSGIVIETEDLTDTGLTLAEKLIQRYPAAELK